MKLQVYNCGQNLESDGNNSKTECVVTSRVQRSNRVQYISDSNF